MRASAARPVRGQRALGLDRLARDRMREGDPPRVQELAVEAVAAAGRRTADRRRPGGRSPACGRGSGGCARSRAGPRAGRRFGSRSHHLEVGDRRSRPAAADDDPLRRAVVAPEGGVDRPRPRGRAFPRPAPRTACAPRGRRSRLRAPCEPRRCGRRRAGPRCRGRAGGRSPGAPDPRRRRAGRRARRRASAHGPREPCGRPGRPACRRSRGARRERTIRGSAGFKARPAFAPGPPRRACPRRPPPRPGRRCRSAGRRRW